mgnify:CR=1 FL=1
MKYCSKCGNELLDEAVICPKCGCPVAAEGVPVVPSAPTLKNAKIKSASTLNLIAFILNAVILVFMVSQFAAIWSEVLPESPTADYNVTVDMFTGNVTGIQDADEEWKAEMAEVQGRQKNVLIAGILWGILAVATFILGLKLKKSALASTGKTLGYIYIILAILTPVIPMFLANILLAFLMCGIGLVFFIPAVLHVIAGIKFIQCINLHA